jgi:hypothetical protein
MAHSLEQLSLEKERACKAQQRQLEVLGQLDEEVRFLNGRLVESEEKANHYRVNTKGMQNEIERLMQVNHCMEERLAYAHERLVQIIAKFRQEYLVNTIECDPITALERYIQYVESLLQAEMKKVET